VEEGHGVSGPGFLERLVDSARRRARQAEADVPALEAEAARAPAPRGFRRALEAGGLRIVAEAKRRSPSRGLLANDDYDPARLAQAYEAAGAAAISVLTEPEFFDGRLEHLAAARAVTRLPLLRKDFLLEPAQVVEARAFGADAVLAIVRILTPAGLSRLLKTADSYGLDVLVEVHSAAELDIAVGQGATLVGVNNRDLDTFETRITRCLELARRIPPHVTAVAESGIGSLDDLRRVYDAGYRAALVGERLMVAGPALLEEARAWPWR
jgi:indole-3-glycerol phosphate synthase